MFTEALQFKSVKELQGIFDNPSLDTPSHLSSVTDFRERDTLEHFYMYFLFDISHLILNFKKKKVELKKN